jgi:hypothetical protein
MLSNSLLALLLFLLLLLLLLFGLDPSSLTIAAVEDVDVDAVVDVDVGLMDDNDVDNAFRNNTLWACDSSMPATHRMATNWCDSSL